MPLVFSYGNLQQEKVQLHLFGQLLSGEADSLYGYRLARIANTDKTILPNDESEWQYTLLNTADKNSRVDGTLFTLTDHQLNELDANKPRDYRRMFMTLSSGKRAWVFLLGA